MADHIYQLMEIVGTSSESISKAIDNGISKAAASVKNLGWFEVVQTRGHISDGKVGHYQVTMKIGYTLE